MIRRRAAADWPTSGLELIVDFTGGQVEVLRVSHIRHAPQMHLYAPLVSEEHGAELTSGQMEIVLSLLDYEGKEVEALGFSFPDRRYWDAGEPEAGVMRNGPRNVRQGEPDIRSLRIPWSDRVGFMFFYRSVAIISKAEPEIHRRPLLIVRARPGDEPVPPVLPHELKPPRVVLPPFPPQWARKPRPLPLPIPTPIPGQGKVIDVSTPVWTGDPGERFDIVITGDGFTEAEMGTFDNLAQRLMSGLQAMAPFASLAPLINWHIVRVASTDSGIDHCPRPDSPAKRTFYGVEGCWSNTDCPGYVGTTRAGLIEWAVENVVPWEDCDLVIIIANCAVYGGHAWPSFKTAIVTTDAFSFVNLAAHESAHVISRLAEEYIACTKDDPKWPDPNKARVTEVAKSVARHVRESEGRPLPDPAEEALEDTIWWKGLTADQERNADGTFRAVHVLGDPLDPADLGQICPLVPAGQEDFIGAYWGCQDVADRTSVLKLIRRMFKVPGPTAEAIIDTLPAMTSFKAPKDADPCNPWWDPRGAYYFRAQATCRMRNVHFEFCHVCQHLLTNSVREVAGLAPILPIPD